MRLIKEMRGDAVVLTLKGEFDSFVCNPFLEQMDNLLAADIKYTVLNMRYVRFINSTGIGSIIKTREKLNKKEGDLVVSNPSKSVSEVLQSLGLIDTIKIFDSDKKALDYLDADDGIKMNEGSNLLVHSIGEGGSPIVGQIKKLEEGGMHFNLACEASGMAAGSEVKLKFRLPLFDKSHYFEIRAEITETVHSKTGAAISAKFTHISDEDRKSISQFVKDMQFLKREGSRS